MYTLSTNAFNGKLPQIDENAFVAPHTFLSGGLVNMPASGQVSLLGAM